LPVIARSGGVGRHKYITGPAGTRPMGAIHAGYRGGVDLASRRERCGAVVARGNQAWAVGVATRPTRCRLEH
jgi:hypothetical protein